MSTWGDLKPGRIRSLSPGDVIGKQTPLGLLRVIVTAVRLPPGGSPQLDVEPFDDESAEILEKLAVDQGAVKQGEPS